MYQPNPARSVANHAAAVLLVSCRMRKNIGMGIITSVTWPRIRITSIGVARRPKVRREARR